MVLSGDESRRLVTGGELSAEERQRVLAPVRGKRVLITGAGGFIGSALARSVARSSTESLVLLDIAEAGLHELSLEIERDSYELVVGDVGDAGLLQHLFERHHPQIVFHAAAYKHVSLMEQNPFSAAKTNILGTQRIADAAGAFGAEQLVLISTDKAVAPAGVMGATKRIAEMILLKKRSATKMKALRLGNVYGSSGSVVPILRDQIARGGPLTITDPACERYFVSLDDAVQWLLLACHPDASAGLYVPRAAEPRRIVDLADDLLARAGLTAGSIDQKLIGLRPGEKLRERMTSEEESITDSMIPDLQLVVNENIARLEELHRVLEDIATALKAWDLSGLLRAIRSIVTDYEPSPCLERQAERVRSVQA